jgi:exodeoxyribonuclease V alpha subunit
MPPVYVPKNRAATEHRGALDRVIHSDPAQPFCILALTDGAVVKGDADADQFTRGTIYRFLGRWRDNDKKGPQFHFDGFVVHAAHTRAGVVKYLSEASDQLPPKIITRIWEKFREDSVSILRTDPARVATECNLSPDLCELASVDLQRGARFEDVKVELFQLFQGRGFHGKLIDAAITKWGLRAPAVIRKNPFNLLSMPSAGFRRCDRLWTDFNLPKDSLKRTAIVAAHLVKSDRNGHTWLAAADLAAKLREMIPGADVMRAFKLALRARFLKKYKDRANAVWLSSYHRATSEERIAASLARLSAAPCLWPTDRVPVSQVEGDRLPSQHQVDRLKLATAGPVGLLLGGPGTGKSHSVAYLLREVIAEFGHANICAVAPTGKAAVRITQALNLATIDLTAHTIHSTLEIGRNGHDGDGWGFVHNAKNPLPYQFLLCDETSMCDADLLADTLDACATGAQVLFVGDPYQLPPVGHGAPLRDMIEAKVPHGELTEVRRNAGQIVHACVRIKNGESFDTCSTPDLAPADGSPPKNLRLIEARDESHARERLVELLKVMQEKAGQPDRLDKSPHDFHPTWQTQVIVARNTKGEICRKRLNELLQPLLNPDGYAVAGNPFKVGDKIICTRNSYMHQVEGIYTGQADNADIAKLAENYEVLRDPEGQPVELYVANGEIGRVVAVAGKLTVARFSESDTLVKIPMGKQRDEDEGEGEGGEDGGGGRGCNFDLGYAVTGHRMQGSESPCVIVMGDEQGGMIATREWIYTSISRASKLCILIGKMSTFNKMKDRRVLNRRKTFLREAILEVRYAEL